jgi:hypothetical protein
VSWAFAGHSHYHAFASGLERAAAEGGNQNGHTKTANYWVKRLTFCFAQSCLETEFEVVSAHNTVGYSPRNAVLQRLLLAQRWHQIQCQIGL